MRLSVSCDSSLSSLWSDVCVCVCVDCMDVGMCEFTDVCVCDRVCEYCICVCVCVCV